MGLAETVAIEMGLYALFRSHLGKGNLPTLPTGGQVSLQDLDRLVFEYSRLVLTSIIDSFHKIAIGSHQANLILSTEEYIEHDFVCSFSMKHIDSPAFIMNDKNERKVLFLIDNILSYVSSVIFKGK